MWEWKLLTHNVFDGKTGACVPFAYECMARKPFRLEYLAPLDAMADIGEFAVAADVGSVAAEDTDIMKHRRLGHEVFVDFETTAAYTFKSLVSDHFAMNHNDFMQVGAGLVIFLNNLIHLRHEMNEGWETSVTIGRSYSITSHQPNLSSTSPS